MFKEQFKKQFNRVVGYVQFWQKSRGFLDYDHYFDILEIAGDIRGQKYQNNILDNHTKGELKILHDQLCYVSRALESKSGKAVLYTKHGELSEQIKRFLYFFEKDIEKEDYDDTDLQQVFDNTRYYTAAILLEALKLECPEIEILGSDSGLIIESN